jgi:hypothetical protein
MDGALERMVAVPLVLDLAADTSADASAIEPDSSDAARPVALADAFELTADSLEVISAADVIERVIAVGDARSVSRSRDSLNVEVLPELARSDWLEGDTVVITLVPVPDSVSGADSAGAAYEVERIVARVAARSLYRLPPEDSAAVPGVDPPAVHYVVGNEITLIMAGGEVQSMEVVGQTSGVHLEPARMSRDSLPDSVAVAPDSASTANDFSLSGVDAGLGRSSRLVGDPYLRSYFQPPAKGRRPWSRR